MSRVPLDLFRRCADLDRALADYEVKPAQKAASALILQTAYTVAA